MKKLYIFCSIVFLNNVLVSALASASPLLSPLKVALILDKGSKDDKSFNAAAYEGATKAQKELGIELKYVEATDSNAFEGLHRSFAKKNFDLIIGVGFSQIEAIKKVSAQNPKINFVIVDGEIVAPNVRSLMFEEHEGSFLVGALAALKTKTNKVSFIGGMDVPLIRRFAVGYAAGAKHVNPKITVLENYIGISDEAWNNPAKAKELARSQYSGGSDIIFVAAGASGVGVFDAAQETKHFAIGVDSNQNWMRPGFILTSMLKRADVAVFDAIQLAKENKFKAGTVRYNIENKGIDYSVDEFNKTLITPDMLKKLDEFKAQILAKKIVVPDYYKIKAKGSL